MSDLDEPIADEQTTAFDRLEGLEHVRRTNGARTTPAPKLTRRGRVSKWDRPKQPRDWRWWVGGVGKVLISTGILMFLFVAYQLWGTGIETARAQNKLENQFEALLAEAPPVTAPDVAPAPVDPAPEPGADPEPAIEPAPAAETSTEPAAEPVSEPAPAAVPAETLPPVPVEAQNLPELEDGDALARIEIPAIGVSDIVVAGVKTRDLKKGPGHFPDTPLPGQLGNSAIAGHRTTYGQPFYNVDKLDVGDEIIMTTLNGTFTYRVTGQQIVSPRDYWVVATTDPTRATLTLTSCHPKYTSTNRIVIFSELVPNVSAPVGEPVINYGRPDEPEVGAEAAGDADDGGGDTADDGVLPGENIVDETTEPAGADASTGATGNVNAVPATGSAADVLGTPEVNEGIADAFSESWFSDPSANPHVAFWGVVLSLIALGAYQVSRKLRRDWAGALVGIVPFTIALYFFFQNVNRLLPPNL